MVAADPKTAEADPEFAAAEEFMASALPLIDRQAACAYLGFFRGIGDARMTSALVDLARSPGFLVRCGRVERTAWFGAPEVLVAGAPMQDLVLQGMAVIAVGNRELRGFLARASTDAAYDGATRARMKGILDQIGGSGN